MIDFRDVTRPVYHAMKFGGHYRPSRPAVALIISLDGKCDAPGWSERMFHTPKGGVPFSRAVHGLHSGNRLYRRIHVLDGPQT
jgi:hypothetical protein